MTSSTRKVNAAQPPAPRLTKAQIQAEIDRLWADHKNWTALQVKCFPTDRVLAAVATAHGLTVDDIRSTRRTRRYCMARHHAVWELRRRRQDLGYQQIAAEMDRLDHTTAVHSYNKFCDLTRAGQFVAERLKVNEILEEDT